MTLNECKKGNTYIIKNIMVEDRIIRRLEALGLIDGTRIDLLNKKRYGAVIIKVRGTRIALGKDLAMGIEVSANE
ncbi:MAG: ferrous iron transport protein A [Butyrivibrio sp.]